LEGTVEFHFDDPATCEKRTVKDDLYGILSDSPSVREAVLRRNRLWFDCQTEIFENTVGVIVTTEDMRQRIEATLRWRNSSAGVYYEKLTQIVSEREGFQITEFLPPSADGLLRHFRLRADLHLGSAFDGNTATAAQTLLREEGLLEAINRLSGFPVPLPSILIDAFADLTPEKIHPAVVKLIRGAQSPISRIHLIRILVRLADKAPAFQRIAHQIAINLLSPQGLEECEAFGSLLMWVHDEFGHWHGARQSPVPIRLAMIWAHSDRLFRILKSAGALSSWIHEFFENAMRRVPSELFERDLDFRFDIAHPRQFNTEAFVLAGLAYGLGEAIEKTADEKLGGLIKALASREVEEKPVPNLALLRDPKLSEDSLGSLLALDRGLAFFTLLRNGTGETFKRESLLTSLEEAVDRIITGSERTLAFDWALVYSIVGDLPPPHGCIQKIKDCLYQIDLVALFTQEPLFGGAMMQSLCSQVGNLHDEDLRLHMKGQLLKVAEHLAKAAKAPGDQVPDDDSGEKAKIRASLFESALALSAAVLPNDSAAAEFGRITIQMIEAWRDSAPKYRPIIQQLCEELPLGHAKGLWPLLIRLRAEA
jgi:hypothetical protein